MSTVTTQHQITGMSCAHCEGAISDELSKVTGVSEVQADAGAGTVTITWSGEPDDQAVAAAVDEAGYELADRTAGRS